MPRAAVAWPRHPAAKKKSLWRQGQWPRSRLSRRLAARSARWPRCCAARTPPRGGSAQANLQRVAQGPCARQAARRRKARPAARRLQGCRPQARSCRSVRRPSCRRARAGCSACKRSSVLSVRSMLQVWCERMSSRWRLVSVRGLLPDRSSALRWQSCCSLIYAH